MNEKHDKTANRSLRRSAFAGALIAAALLGACAPRVDTRGNQVYEEDLAAIEPGQSTRSQVLDRLGSPSNQGTFGQETWFYVSEQTETTAFFAPEVTSRQVVVIQFDEAGVVSNVDTLDEAAGEIVEPAAGATPTAGNKLNFFEQMLSNLGRFNKDKKN